MIEKERKRELMDQYARHPKDAGSPEIQVAILTERIRQLSDHFAKHPKDTNSKRGFMIMIGKRRRLLAYLKHRDYQSYRKLIESLGLRK